MSETKPPTPKLAKASLWLGIACVGALLLVYAAHELFSRSSALWLCYTSSGVFIGTMPYMLLVFIALPSAILIALTYSIIAVIRIKTVNVVGKCFCLPIAILCLAIYPGIVRMYREDLRRITCASIIGNIRMSMAMYASDWNGHFPTLDGAEGLEMLRSQGYLESHKFYICPSTTTQGTDGARISEKTTDYVYYGGYTEEDGDDIPLILDKPANHRSYGNVQFIGWRNERFFGRAWEEIQAQAKATHERVVGPRRAKVKPDKGAGELPKADKGP